MKKTFLILTVVLILIPGSCDYLTGTVEPTGTIEGRVVVDLSDTFFNTILVYVDDVSTAHTLEGDILTIPDVEPGPHSLEIHAFQKIPFRTTINVTEDTTTDIGDVELEQASVIYVAAAGDDGNSGLEGSAPLASLSRAVDVAGANDAATIKISTGTYDLGGEKITVNSSLVFLGGYPTTSWGDEDRDVDTSPVVLTGAETVFGFYGAQGCWLALLTVRPTPVEEGTSVGFDINGSDVGFWGVTIDGVEEDYYGIEAVGVYHNSSLKFFNSTLDLGNADRAIYGISACDSSSVEISESTITTGKAGIRDTADVLTGGTEDDSMVVGVEAASGAIVEINNSTITLGESWNNNFGVRAWNSSDINISESNINGGRSVTNSGFGVYCGDFSSLLISSSEINAGEAADMSAGVQMIHNTELILQSSIVRGGVSNSSGEPSAGLVFYDLSSGRIAENTLIEAGAAPDSYQAGIRIAGTGDIQIVNNLEISGGSGGAASMGINIQDGLGEISITNNDLITGGTAESYSADISTNGYRTVEISDNILEAGNAALVRNIKAETYYTEASIVISSNELIGGSGQRDSDSVAQDLSHGVTNIRLAGYGTAHISKNSITGGSMENEVDDDWPGGVTVLEPGMENVWFDSNTVRALDPYIDSGTSEDLYLRGVHGGARYSRVYITNNLMEFYTPHGSLHVLEAENYTECIAGNNTMITHSDESSYGASLFSYHWNSAYDFVDNIVFSIDGMDDSFAPQEGASLNLDSNILINYNGTIDTGVTSSGNLSVDTATGNGYFVSPDSDLSDDSFGDWHLNGGTDPVEYGQGNFSLIDDLVITWDIESNNRSWEPWADTPDSTVDAGAYEYID